MIRARSDPPNLRCGSFGAMANGTHRIARKILTATLSRSRQIPARMIGEEVTASQTPWSVGPTKSGNLKGVGGVVTAIQPYRLALGSLGLISMMIAISQPKSGTRLIRIHQPFRLVS